MEYLGMYINNYYSKHSLLSEQNNVPIAERKQSYSLFLFHCKFWVLLQNPSISIRIDRIDLIKC